MKKINHEAEIQTLLETLKKETPIHPISILQLSKITGIHRERIREYIEEYELKPLIVAERSGSGRGRNGFQLWWKENFETRPEAIKELVEKLINVFKEELNHFAEYFKKEIIKGEINEIIKEFVDLQCENIGRLVLWVEGEDKKLGVKLLEDLPKILKPLG